MDARQLEYFLAVVDNDGLVVAAEVLGVTKASLSKGVRNLESELGVALFHRVGRGLVTTDAGRALVGPARTVVRGLAAVDGVLPGADGMPRGHLDLAAPAHVAEGPVTAIVGRFVTRYPGVTVRLADLRPGDTAAGAVRDGLCEIAITHLPVPASGLTVTPLGVHEYWLVLPPGFPAGTADIAVASGDPYPLADLPPIPMVGLPKASSSRTVIERALQSAGSRTVMSAIVDQREAVGAFVVEGVGMSIMERGLAERARVVGARVHPLDPPVTAPYGLVADLARLSSAGRAFVDMATNAAAAGVSESSR
ncbi:LysR family transcriptional regulator [uncultured Williamsia sp.]|uniref:LysR family transcriptional regulator n=1 Tax=uncultured Williamsia sp. TaxID=259311 RepID=UPI002612D1E4|nr:LysR family transcriptional regulator [uncultured Williamsia sp.]